MAFELESFNLKHATDVGIHPAFVAAAAASGIDFKTLLQYITKHGLEVLCLLAMFYKWPLPPGLCSSGPPLPPLPPPK